MMKNQIKIYPINESVIDFKTENMKVDSVELDSDQIQICVCKCK